MPATVTVTRGRGLASLCVIHPAMSPVAVLAVGAPRWPPTRTVPKAAANNRARHINGSISSNISAHPRRRVCEGNFDALRRLFRVFVLSWRIQSDVFEISVYLRG